MSHLQCQRQAGRDPAERGRVPQGDQQAHLVQLEQQPVCAHQVRAQLRRLIQKIIKDMQDKKG